MDICFHLNLKCAQKARIIDLVYTAKQIVSLSQRVYKLNDHDDVFQVKTIVDTVQQCLIKIRDLSLDEVPDETKAEYKKRKLIAEV